MAGRILDKNAGWQSESLGSAVVPADNKKQGARRGGRPILCEEGAYQFLGIQDTRVMPPTFAYGRYDLDQYPHRPLWKATSLPGEPPCVLLQRADP